MELNVSSIDLADPSPRRLLCTQIGKPHPHWLEYGRVRYGH